MHPLTEILESLCQTQSVADLKHAYETLSKRYRDNAIDKQISSSSEAMAYAAARMPATYSATIHVLKQLQQIDPDFRPQKCLDIGAGPATASLACHHFFPSLSEFSLLEKNKYLIEIAERILKQQDISASIERQALQDFKTDTPFDLIVASYVLNEISEDSYFNILQRYWSLCANIFIVIEAGTPCGFSTLLKVRQILSQELGAFILAPCPHSFVCGKAAIKDQDWCHFSCSVDRNFFHRAIKSDNKLGHEYENFSYLIVAKNENRNRPTQRLITPVHGQKIIAGQVCQADGQIQSFQLSKRDPDYKRLKKASWGDGFLNDKNNQ
jgi:ribosomal protein RSM22 (predicted rRNA methylase)